MNTNIIANKLFECEQVIERGLNTFVEVGAALLEIRDNRLYKDNYSTFEEYCRERWGMVRRQADRLIQSAEVAENLRPIGLIPANEAQARPLVGLLPEQQVQVWQEAIETAPEGKVTAAHVQEVVRKNVHIANNSGENEWYTPPEYIESARKVMGRIDLDPASSEMANKIIKASKFYTRQDDGLSKFWAGKVWMNPPYAADLIGKFIAKYAEHARNGDIKEGIVLVNNATETGWFSVLVNVSSAITFPTGRIRFINKNGKPENTPLQGQAFLYVGKSPDKFIKQFSVFGWSAKTCAAK